MRRCVMLAACALLSMGCNIVFGVSKGKPREQSSAPAGPALFASVAELQAVKAKVDAGAEPWASAYQAFVQDADAALTRPARSVVDNGPGAEQSDPHVFASDSLNAGCADFSSGRHDYCAALEVGSGARDLAIAYVMTRDEAYAERAIDLIHHWCVAPDTAMLPLSSNGGPHNSGASAGSPIEIYLALPTFFYAASFLRGHPHWQSYGDDGETQFLDWVDAFSAAAKADPENTGAGTRYLYYLVAVASAEALLERQAGVDQVLTAWRSTMDTAVDADGAVLTGSGVADSWFALKGMVYTAQLASYWGGDLYAFADAAGSSPLERAAVYLAPCASLQGTCPISETLDGSSLDEGMSSYELIYSRYPSSELLAALEARPRPVWDIRVLGWTTLTHGNRFDLDLPP